MKRITLLSRTLLVPMTLLVACVSGPSPSGDVDTRKARNVILFIGDGMGVSTVTAGRIYDGQMRGIDGESHQLAFETFPQLALVKTYNSNQQVPDSAGTASAMLTGRKTRAGVINTSPDVLRGDCQVGGRNGLVSLATLARSRGMATGVVTTARLTHATPATMYAQSSDREWESDRYLSAQQLDAGCRDIARQLVADDHGAGMTVSMGGGRRSFYGESGGGVRRSVNDDLVAEWLAGGANRRFVSSAAALAEARPGERVLGLFAQSHMGYMAERNSSSTEPTLTEMTVRALDLLESAGEGYFLMVESGRIDHGHHDGKPGYALEEMREFNRAIETALERIDTADTLVLVTADHSHVFTMGGYATRGNPILGLVVENDRSGRPRSEPALATDGRPYTTLGYYNGPGAVGPGARPAPSTGVDAIAQALVPVRHRELDGTWSFDESHGGEDVALYATGPGADRVRGVMEQNRIFEVMRGALELDP